MFASTRRIPDYVRSDKTKQEKLFDSNISDVHGKDGNSNIDRIISI